MEEFAIVGDIAVIIGQVEQEFLCRLQLVALDIGGLRAEGTAYAAQIVRAIKVRIAAAMQYSGELAMADASAASLAGGGGLEQVELAGGLAAVEQDVFRQFLRRADSDLLKMQ